MSATVPIKTEEVILENVEYQSTEELDEELQLQLEDSGGESYILSDNPGYESSSTKSRQRHHTSSSNNDASGGGGSSNNTNQMSSTKLTTCSSSSLAPPSPIMKTSFDTEKRMRREIANSNERRRMQSINAGFQNLRQLLPRHEGEKLSKAAILQQTSQYICDLENQKTQLLAQNSQLKRQLGQHEAASGGGGAGHNTNSSNNTETVENTTTGGANVAIKKRKLTDNVANVQTVISDSSDEGLGSMSPEPMTLLSGGGAGAAAAAAAAANAKAQLLLAQNSKDLLDLKEQLFKERRLRTVLEDELQMIKRQLYSVATAPQPTASAVEDECDGGAAGLTTTAYIPREVIEHTGSYIRDDCEEFSYVEIDELTGQQQVVVCSSIEELDSESAAAAAEIITEDNVHEEIVLSSTSSTESEQEVAVNAIAKAYAEGNSPTPAMLQPILQAAIKATPKVEVERITDAALKKVKTEKIEQTSGLTRSRQNLETIVEAIRHLEGDHLFTDSNGEQRKVVLQTTQSVRAGIGGQDVPLALTTKQHVVAQRKTLAAELRPFLQLKPGTNKLTILTKATPAGPNIIKHEKLSPVTAGATPTAIFKVQTTALQQQNSLHAAGGNNTTTLSSTATSAGISSNVISISSNASTSSTVTGLKQCRPGVIVAKQLS